MSDERISNLSLLEKAQLVTGGGFWTTRGFERAGIAPLKTSDGPAGLRVQAENRSDSMGLNKSVPATCFPAHSALACSFDKTLVFQTAERIGEEALSFGVDILLAPAVNVKRNPLCGRNFEYFSEDEYLSGALGSSFVNGLQSTGVGACVKHFAANNKEFGRTVSDSVVDERTLREIYLTPFEMCAKISKPRAFMTAYNRLNGTFCNENARLIRDILRGEWGFDGIVVSDWGGTHDRAAAIEAGADLEMPACKFSVDEVVNAVEDGRLSVAALDECCGRIARASDFKITQRDCDFTEHAEFAVRCAENCAVLLKNDGVLPLKSSEKIAVVGEAAKKPVYQGGGSSHVNHTGLTNLYDSLSREYTVTGYARGIRRAVRLAKRSDAVILCLGLSAGDAEGMDRSSLSLPENQLELLSALKNTGTPVICVLSCGGAVDCFWNGGVSALLYAGLNGQGGAQAIANVISGRVNPSGKLAEGFPEGEAESTRDFNESPYYTVYREGMRIGHKSGAKYFYPFGYGLSYTSFEYSDLILSGSGAEFTLKNTGGRDGAEAVQLYVKYPENAGGLTFFKGFEKVFLKAGKSKRVFIPFDEYTFRSYDEKRGKWGICAGQFEICIGSSSRDIKLMQKLAKTGDMSGVTAPNTAVLTPESYGIQRDGRGRVTATLSTPFSELHASRALLVRLFVKAALGLFKNNPTVGGTMNFVTLRMAAQFARFNSVQAQGFIDAFNGKYIRGAVKMLKYKAHLKRERQK